MTAFSKLLSGKSPYSFKKEDLAQKIGLILIVASLIVITLIISLFSMFSQKKDLETTLANGRSLTKMVAAYSSTELDRDEANRILKIVSLMGSRNGLVYGMIMDSKGRVIAHTDPDLVDIPLNDPIARQAASSNNPLSHVLRDPVTHEKIYEFSRPLFRKQSKVGAVRLGFSQGANPFFSVSDFKILSVVAILVFILVPIFYYLMKSSLRPLASLNNELKSVLEQSEFQKIQGNLEGGIGDMVERLTQVVSTMKDRYDRLLDSYHDIEVSNKILAYEKDRIESIMDNLKDGILVTNSAGKIILVNREMAHLMRTSKESWIGKALQECFDNEKIQALIERDKFHEDLFAEKQTEIVITRSNTNHIFRISYLSLLSAKEDLLGYMMQVKDITAQKLIEKNQTEFIAHVSHELRTPLTTIKSYVEMLADDEINDKETKIEFYNTINDETERLARLIENLLNISKIEMGSMMIEKDLLKPHAFFEDMIRSIESQAISKNITLETLLPEKMSLLFVDKDLIRVALLNILINAIKYTSEGGAVTIRVTEEGEHIRIEIMDTGYGISEEERHHIFEKFYRSSSENIKNQTGNGLGLALSNEIINLHNGEIDVSSTVGEGSHFTVLLPLDQDPRIRKLEHYGQSIEQTLQGMDPQENNKAGGF